METSTWRATLDAKAGGFASVTDLENSMIHDTSILKGVVLINHPFWGTLYGTHHLDVTERFIHKHASCHDCSTLRLNFAAS